MAACPRCRRPVALTRPTCLYCGAALPVAAAAAPAPAVSAPRSERQLVVLEGSGLGAAPLARALGVTEFEAEQWLRRGGPRLYRALSPGEAESEAARLRGHGLRVTLLPEAEVDESREPVAASGGGPDGAGLRLRTETGVRTLRAADVMLVVRGAIAREYQTAAGIRRPRLATLEPGYRFHLHLGGERPPLELDPSAFAFFGAPATVSSLLTLSAWLESALRGVPSDDGFRHLAPALGPAEPSRGPLAAAEALRAPRRASKEAPLMLDNVRQFRLYSAWRACWERRRHT